MAGWYKSLNLENLTAQVNGLTQSIGEGASRISHGIQEQVSTLAKFELEDIEKAIRGVEDGLVPEEMMKKEDAGLKQVTVKFLPWETRLEHKAILSHALMEKVLALSVEESNFTTPPPPAVAKSAMGGVDNINDKRDEDTTRCSTDTAVPFQLERHINVAIRMLSLDPNLARIHARLISNMPETTFWRNYFSRIGSLRAEAGMEPLCEESLQDGSGALGEEYDKVSHGDVQSVNSPSGPSPKVTNASGQGDADDDYSDLGDLDDLDGDSDSNIDDTLEAEIAAELGDG